MTIIVLRYSGVKVVHLIENLLFILKTLFKIYLNEAQRFIFKLIFILKKLAT